MVETPQDELSLRDIVEVLKRHRVYLWAFPLILAALALIYGFLIAEPTYASTATLSVAPVQVQAQLEQRIQVQQATPITFEGLKALALSEETVGEVWEALRKEGKLPTRWQDRGGLRGIERMMRDLKVKDISPKLQAANPNQVPPIVASLTVQAPDPQVAAKAANLWVEAVKRRVNAIPLARLEASLKALEEQVTPAEKAYREAQARWEAFNKTTTLPQDKAELDAKTQERVGLDTELAGLERDLAAVQGRIQATLAEMRRQEAIVPIGTPPEQLAIINRRLAEAQASLARELERVRQSYTQAAQVLEKFKGREQIPVWQAELSAYTEAYASAQARLIALQKDLAQKQALLQDAEARLAEYKAQLPNLSIENLVAGLTVKEAEALVADRLKEADSRLKAAEGAWAEFQRKSQLEVWKRQLGGYADRVASIRQRLESLATDRFRVEADLGEARRRFDQYKAQLPNLSIENLVAGLTVKEAEALVADRLKEADSRLKAAEGAWAEFQRKSQLEVWKRQLGGYADRVASIRQRLESLATDRFRVEADLGEARRRFDQYKAQLPNLSIENLVAGLTVKEAEALVADRLKEADSRLKAAEGAWAEFQRKSQLEVWKRQLGGYADRVASIRQRLESLATDRFRVEADLGEARRRFDQYKAQLPNLSIENLVAGLTVKEAEALVADRLKEADSRLKAAEGAWAEFQRKSQLEVWKRQLGGYADRVASIRQRLESLATDRFRVEADLGEARRRFDQYKAQLPNLSIENLVAGLTVKEAEALVADRLKEADSRLKAAEGAWAEFQRKSQLEVWKRQLGGYADRVASIRQRLESLATERAIKQTRLEEAEKELAKEPRLIALEREITADPAVAAAIAQGGNLRDLLGLKLKNQELNPTHLKLLSTALDLRADLAALDREEKALKEEEAKLAPLVQDLQRRIADEEATRARLLTELDTARDIYNAVYRYAESLKKVASRPDAVLREVSPDVLAYRDRIVDLEARLVALKAEEEALKEEEAKLAPLVQDLQRRIADEEATRARLLTELDTARDIYNAVYRYAESLKKVASRPDAVLREVSPDVLAYRDRIVDLEARLVALKAEEEALKEEEAKLAPLVQDLQRRIADEEATRARLLTELDTARDIYNAVYRYAESLKKVASRPDAVLREVSPDVLAYRDRIVDLEARLVALKAEEEALKEEEAKLAPLVQDLQRRIADEEATRARLLTELDTARDIYNAVYRYAESLKKVASRPDAVLREVSPDVLAYRDRIVDLEARLVALKAEEEALKEEEAKLAPLVQDLQRRIADEEATRARLLTELDTARDIYNAVYRYAESLKKVASRPDAVLREVSPDVLAYRDRVVGLRAEITGLKAEEGALKRNLTELDGRIRDRKAKIAAQEREKEAVTLEYATKKAAYEAFRSRYDQIASLTAQDLTFDNPNPEFQRLRSALIDAQAEEARLSARRAALLARINQVEARLGLLKDRVAKAQVEQDTVNQALELAKNAYLALAQKRTDLQIQIASNQEAWASILAPAYPVYEKVAPKRGLLLALAVALGLMLGVMAAFVAEALRPKEPAPQVG
jgi:chromosome segregation ATPase